MGNEIFWTYQDLALGIVFDEGKVFLKGLRHGGQYGEVIVETSAGDFIFKKNGKFITPEDE